MVSVSMHMCVGKNVSSRLAKMFTNFTLNATNQHIALEHFCTWCNSRQFS